MPEKYSLQSCGSEIFPCLNNSKEIRLFLHLPVKRFIPEMILYHHVEGALTENKRGYVEEACKVESMPPKSAPQTAPSEHEDH